MERYEPHESHESRCRGLAGRGKEVVMQVPVVVVKCGSMGESNATGLCVACKGHL